MSKDRPEPSPITVTAQQPVASPRAEIEAFLGQVKALDPSITASERGRLIYALDATMSRQPTWDQACHLQAEMFREAAAVGGLDLQLVYYRGLAECRASAWIAEPKRFGELMSRIDCRGGQTQIAKILAHAWRENDRRKVAGFGFVGDAKEETLDRLCADAGQLALRGVPVFMFQEGYDPVCERAFREIARLTRGAYCRFEPGAAHELGKMLIGLLGEIDEDSRPLLTAYLDRREPHWREHAADDDTEENRSHIRRNGKMTDEEAYQILGIKPGATAEEIAGAYRSLMKKLHPDQGGSTYLAAQINQAKEVLLRRHR